MVYFFIVDKHFFTTDLHSITRNPNDAFDEVFFRIHRVSENDDIAVFGRTPTIMAGINQTTMMALSMVVIASMIGAGGLGYEVLQGIQRLDVSRGLFAGLGIVFLAIIFDRLVQAYGKRVQKHLEAGNT